LPIKSLVAHHPPPISQEDFAMRSSQNAPTVEKLIANLQDADQVVRIHAATILGLMGEDAEAAVPALIELLNNGDIHDRKLAALSLGEIGPAAFEAIPALFVAAEDGDDGLAEMAEEALEQIDLIEGDVEAA
jgi:HEAT repeat protein